MTTATRNVLIRKFHVKTYPEFDRAFDACLLVVSFYSIVFIFAIRSIEINIPLVVAGTCAGISVLVARILIVISVSTGHASVAGALFGTFCIW